MGRFNFNNDLFREALEVLPNFFTENSFSIQSTFLSLVKLLKNDINYQNKALHRRTYTYLNKFSKTNRVINILI